MRHVDKARSGGTMATTRRPLKIIGVTALLLIVSGCLSDTTQWPLTPAQWATDAGPFLNCQGSARTRSVQYYDIAHSGTMDAVVDLFCAGATDATMPDQVEVFPRDAIPTQRNRIARLTWRLASPVNQIFLAHGCIYFTGYDVVIVGQKRVSNDKDLAPSLLVAEVATWSKSRAKLLSGAPQPVQNPDGLPPGCP
jgi:hypothetical protein